MTKTDEALRKARDKTGAALDKADGQAADQRATTTEPATQPPLHGTDPHGQGGVAVVDLDPSNERPLATDPTGQASGEDVDRRPRARRARPTAPTTATSRSSSLFGQELAGVDTAQGETKNGPLQPLQTGILDPLCTNTTSRSASAS